MIVFNCTKAAAHYLFPKRYLHTGAPAHEIHPIPDFAIDHRGSKLAPISQWMVTHSKIAGENVLYVCHANHRYTISLTGIAKGNVEDFFFMLYGRLIAQFAYWLEQMPFDVPLKVNQWMENYFNAHQGIYFCHRWDASIQASINKVSVELEANFLRNGRLPEKEEEGTYFDIEKNLRYEHPSKIKRSIIPTNEIFNEFLTNYMGVKKKDIMTYRAMTEEFFKNMTLNRILEGDDNFADEAFLEAIETQYHELVKKGDRESASILEALLKYKKIKADNQN